MGRRSGARYLRILGVLLATLGLIAPWTPAARADDPAPAIGLDWGLKDSWRHYIGDSGIAVSNGASINGDGSYHFLPGQATYDEGTRTTRARYTGTVSFKAWCGKVPEHPNFCALDSTLSNPEVIIGPEAQTLSFEVRANNRNDPPAPGQPPHDFGRIVLAQLGIDAAQVSVADGQTRWAGVTAVVAGGQAPSALSYYEGTRLDDLSFGYRGPGGKPDLGEKFDAPGVPAYANAESFYGNPTGNGTYLFPRLSEDGTVLFLLESVQSVTVIPRIQALDPRTLTRLPNGDAGISVTESSRISPASVGFDPVSKTFFYVEREAGERRVRAVQWRDGRFVHSEIGTLTSTSNSESLTWVPVRRELVAIDAQGALATVFRPAETGWARREIALPDPATLPFLSWVDKTKLKTYYRGIFPVALPDGSIVMANNQFAQGFVGMPAPRIMLPTDGAGAARVEEIPKSVATSPAGQVWPYFQITPTKDGFALTIEAPDHRQAQLYRIRTDGTLELGEHIDGLGLGLKTMSGIIPAEDGSLQILDGRAKKLLTMRNGAFVAEHDIPDTRQAATGASYGIATGPGKSTYVPVQKDNVWGLQRIQVTGTTPSFTTNPQSEEITVGPGESAREIELSAAATGDPAPTLQWQTRPPGGRFTDIPGANTARLRVDASVNTDQTQYRVLARSASGTVVSETATLTVHAAPVIETPPANQTVRPGEPVTFAIRVDGSRPLTVDWELKLAGGQWTTVSPGGRYAIDDGQLLIRSADESLDGAEVRAVAKNAIGTVRSSTAQLRVVPEDTRPPEPTTWEGVVLEWSGSAEIQARPPNGSTANYFSVGESDGTRGSYAADRDGFTVLQRSGGRDSVATWDSRGAHVGAGGQQLLRLANGKATAGSDGSMRITWQGSFSVNFYDGLVPFTVKNPRLLVNPDGSGTLRGDLTGYHGDMDHPDRPKERARPANDVPIARFGGVKVDTSNGFVVTPSYRGVRIAVPAGESPQVTEGSGWGAWPQEFVNFGFGTGLAGYFYSTGGAMDNHKAPNPFVVGFDRAKMPKPPESPPPGVDEPPRTTPIPPTINRPGGGGSGGTADQATVVGELAWGIKSSFRSYIVGTIAKGRVELGNGAGFSGDAYRFGQTSTSWNPDSGLGDTGYGGSVRFVGHGGVLDVTLADPQVRIESPERGSLVVRMNGGAPVAIGTLNLAAARKQSLNGGVSYTGVPVTLTAAGSKVFSYGASTFYQPGEAMDPLSFVIGKKAPPGHVAGGAGSGSGTGSGALPAAGPGAGNLAAPALPPPAAGCKIVDGSLTWGFKESFRSYISGSIAHGGWEPLDGASYTTPHFSWSRGSGIFEGASGSGEVAYPGKIRFTGHGGLLDTVIANPRIRFVDPSTAYLILDVSGLTMEEALAGGKEAKVATGIPFARLDLTGKLQANADNTTMIATEVTPTLTNEGFGAFPNYPAGTAFDPVSFTFTVDGNSCIAPAANGPVAAVGEVPGAAGPPSLGGTGMVIPWHWLALGGAGLLLLGTSVGAGISLFVVNKKLAGVSAALTAAGMAQPTLAAGAAATPGTEGTTNA